MTVDFVLDEIDPTVSGIHMQDLISLWIEKGLSFEQFDTIYNVGVLTDSLDDKFVQSLMPPDTNFSRQMPFIISSLEFWDEIPAWHEVCLLKRAFESCEDSSMFAQSFDPLFKRCLIIITQLLPAEALGREKRDPAVRHDTELIRLDQEPPWYQKEFHAYSQRQVAREIRLLRTNEISLRYIFARQLQSITNFCSGPLLDFIEEHVASDVEFGHQEVQAEDPDIYPSEWLDVINGWVVALNDTQDRTLIGSLSVDPDWTRNLDRAHC